MLRTRPSTALQLLAGNESAPSMALLDTEDALSTAAEAVILPASLPANLSGDLSGISPDDQANDNRDTKRTEQSGHSTTALDSGSILASTVPILDVKASTGRQLSAKLAKLGQKATDYKKRVIYDALIERESMLLNSAADGVALISIPLIGLRQPHSFLVRCAAPVPLNTPDGTPIELVFMLLSPVNIGHTKGKSLQVLASAARLLKEPSAREALRQATSANAVQTLLQTAC